MYNLIVLPKAIQATKDSFDWYEEQKQGLGYLFLKELSRCYQRIENNPASYRKLKRNLRQIVFQKFPFVVVFEIQDQVVVVYSVFHTSRNPRGKFKDN